MPLNRLTRLLTITLMIPICAATNLSCVTGISNEVEARKLSLIQLSVPSEPSIPRGWPDSIEFRNSSGTVKKHLGETVYLEYFTRGWNEAIREYDTEMEKTLRHLNDQELAANRDGRDACYKQLDRLEQIYGKTKLKGFILRNVESFRPAY